jgi:calcineurin-like phosphoesterase family protein
MRKQIFFTADLHIGHENSIKLDKRPFKNLEDMHRGIISNFNKQVPADGVTYFLGDVFTHGSEITKAVITQLNGIKILIRGNHDKGIDACYNIGFDAVLHSGSIWIQGETVTMTHCPLRGLFREDTTGMHGSVLGELWHGETRHKDFSIQNYGQFHLHGHIHSPNGGKSAKILDRQFDVGLPANNYRPVHISTIESWISQTKQKELDKK